MRLIDTSRFQFGVVPDDDPEFDAEEERRLLDELADEARSSLEDQGWAPPIQDMLLAFGIGGIIGLYLVRFSVPATVGGVRRDEMWLVVGDIPTICFTTDTSPTRAAALRTYCDIAEEWAGAVLTGGDVSACYNVGVEPTEEHARMLKSRAGTIRHDFAVHLDETDGPPLTPTASG
jgi:hypothetical protein